jgi:hypothetical protein
MRKLGKIARNLRDHALVGQRTCPLST